VEDSMGTEGDFALNCGALSRKADLEPKHDAPFF
jgi:hypothetical protein